MCGILNQYKKCLDSHQTIIGEDLSVEQCQHMCEERASRYGKDGCCEYLRRYGKDQEGTCKWTNQMELKVSDDLRYGALCTTRNGMCLLIL